MFILYIEQSTNNINHQKEGKTMKIQENVAIIGKDSKKVLIYCGRNVPQNQPYYIGTRVISNFLPAELLAKALRLVRENYEGDFLKSALEDFYPRIKALVNKVYKGDVATLTWLAKSQAKLVKENEDLFRKAVAEVKQNPKRKFPENVTGIKQEILAILKGE